LYWKLTESPARLLLINLLALPLGGLAAPAFLGLAAKLGRVGLEALSGWTDYLALAAGLLATLALHELAHGLAMSAYGARPQYGVKWDAGALYATAPGYAFTRNQYLAVIFAPLIALSGLAALGMWAWADTAAVPILALCGVVNAMGACGDVYMGWRVARYPPPALVVDEADGMRVFLPNV
jgi:hypothetical protein